mmetsp:Transcript_10940/g.16944  ORF Transcript_10940/g.16944 Transcript_10940/m.16944 type:complete len:437 (-) Transcript_10940:1248-2558(-)
MAKLTPPIALLCSTIWMVALSNGCLFVSAWMTGVSRPIISSHHHSTSSIETYTILYSTPDDNDEDNWSLDDTESSSQDPRLNAMRTMLESSWNDKTMGVVPTSAEKAAEAAADSVANAMAENHNVVMIDLRLPSYDVTEGPKLYDIMAASDFCASLSDKLREKNLIRKSLVLVRNEKERAEIERVRLQRDEGTTTIDEEVIDDDIDNEKSAAGDDALWGDVGDEKVDDFRAKLMDSWDSPVEELESSATKPKSSEAMTKKIAGKTQSSHRLWSMIGKTDISSGPDMFDQVIAAADENAILSTTGTEPEDALIILSPYDTTDVIAIRRILARYGQTRTVIIVNSRMEVLPAELSSAVLVYAVMPLIARSRNSGDDSNGLKAVVMRRFPSKWAIYVDVYGDGFVEASDGQDAIVGSSKDFPSPEYIAKAVQKHVEGLK